MIQDVPILLENQSALIHVGWRFLTDYNSFIWLKYANLYERLVPSSKYIALPYNSILGPLIRRVGSSFDEEPILKLGEQNAIQLYNKPLLIPTLAPSEFEAVDPTSVIDTKYAIPRNTKV